MAAMIELHVPDFEIAREFYGRIGFTTTWCRPPEGHKGYLVMQWEDNILCFWGGNEDILTHSYFGSFPSDTPRGYGVEIVLCCSDPGLLYESIKHEPWVIAPFKTKPWGLKDFRIRDPFGFYIRITTQHDITNPDFAVP